MHGGRGSFWRSVCAWRVKLRERARRTRAMAWWPPVVDERCAVRIGRRAGDDGPAVRRGAAAVCDRILWCVWLVGRALCGGGGDGVDAAGEPGDAVDRAGLCGNDARNGSFYAAISVDGYLPVCLGRNRATRTHQPLSVCSGRSRAGGPADEIFRDICAYQPALLCAHDLSAGGSDHLLAGHTVFADGAGDETGDVWLRVCDRGCIDCAAESYGAAVDRRADIRVVSAVGLGDRRCGAC